MKHFYINYEFLALSDVQNCTKRDEKLVGNRQKVNQYIFTGEGDIIDINRSLCFFIIFHELKELYCSICKYIQEKYTDDKDFDINCILDFCQSYS